MIIIAHRLNTVRMCNCIHLLNNGEIVSSGTYEQLLSSSNEFNEMVQV
jgi:ABC-type multidrug transport system fused ATPase/permease subunit